MLAIRTVLYTSEYLDPAPNIIVSVRSRDLQNLQIMALIISLVYTEPLRIKKCDQFHIVHAPSRTRTVTHFSKAYL